MPEKDLFRDTWIRYLGYANEVGESFRAVVPLKVVHASYGVAFAYVIADTAHKTIGMIRKDGRPSRVIVETGDALIWQTLASVVIPGFTINRICAYTQTNLRKYGSKVPPGVRNWITVGVGLASIPIIVRPIDAGVSLLMALTYRRWFRE